MQRRRRLVCVCAAVCLLLTHIATPAGADDSLGLLRGEARTGSPDAGSSNTNDSRDKDDDCDDDRKKKNRSNFSNDDDDATSSGMESLIGYGLLGIGAVATSPFWVPPKLLDDAYSEPGYFGRFPYHEHDPGYLSVLRNGLTPESVIDPGKSWGGRVRTDYGSDFDDMSSLNGNLLIDSIVRFGFDGGFEYRRQTHLDSSFDDLWLGDANVLFRFAQHERLVMHAGLGFNWLSDRVATDYGFNFTYRADWFPAEPWIVTGEMDLGTIGHEFMLHLRMTTGVRWRHVEPYVGYDLLDVGRFQSNQFIAGVRVWF